VPDEEVVEWLVELGHAVNVSSDIYRQGGPLSN
jgi:hypothetical protein